MSKITVDKQKFQVMVGGKAVKFTRKEYDIFLSLYQSKNAVLSREEIMVSVWKVSNFIDNNVDNVDQHVSRIRRKLGPCGSSSILTVRTRGYRYVGQGD